MLKIFIISFAIMHVTSLFLVRWITVLRYRHKSSNKFDGMDLFFILVPVVNTLMFVVCVSGIVYRYVKRKIIIFYHWFINDVNWFMKDIKF